MFKFRPIVWLILIASFLTVSPVYAGSYLRLYGNQNSVYAAPRANSPRFNSPRFNSMQLAGANCVAKANQIAGSYGNAQILSVEDNGYSCTIVIRIPGANGNPPRIISKTVSG